MKDYYKILGVDKSATDDEIKKVYREKMKEIHPDLHPDNKSLEEESKEVNNAYEVLGNPDRRKEYDLNISSINSNNYGGNQEQNSSNVSYDNMVNVTMKDFFYRSSVSEKVLIKEFDSFMEYLAEMDKEFKEFGLNSNKLRESLKEKRGKLTSSEINNIKLNVKKQLENLKRCAMFHDNFVFAFNETKKRIERYGGHINEEDFYEYLNPSNRGKKNNDFYGHARERLKELEKPFVESYNQKFSDVSNEFQKRGIFGCLSNYMSRKGAIYSSDLDVNSLGELEQFISLYDQVMSSLSTMRLSLNYILDKLHMGVEDLTLSKLEIISRNVSQMKSNNLFAKRELYFAIENEMTESRHVKK